MREILLRAAGAGLFVPVWSDRILEEWARAAVKLGDEQALIARGEITLVRSGWQDAAVAAQPELEAALSLPDADDVHVLATAIFAGCPTIVTMNLKDFPRRVLAAHGIHAEHPDTFLLAMYNASPDLMHDVVSQVRATAERLSGQEWTFRKLLKKARLPRLGKALERHD